MGIEVDFQKPPKVDAGGHATPQAAEDGGDATYSEWSLVYSSGNVEIGRWHFRGHAREALSGMTEVLVVTAGECDVRHEGGEIHLTIGDCVVLDENAGAFEISAPTHLGALITVIRAGPEPAISDGRDDTI